MAEMLAKMAARWRITGHTPQAMHYARQANLVKESEIKPDKMIEAGNLRPISVISSLWLTVSVLEKESLTCHSLCSVQNDRETRRSLACDDVW